MDDLLKTIMGTTSLAAYTHPLFRTAEEHFKKWAQFIPKSPNQPDDVMAMLNIASAPTKVPTNYSLGAIAQNNENKQV